MAAPIYHTVPEWLTKSYVENIFKIYYKNDHVRISKLHINPATPKGDNYSSVISRIHIEFENENLEPEVILIKMAFDGDDYAKENIGPYDIYNREIEIYERVLPKLTCLLGYKIFAETLHTDYEHTSLVFEDLCKQSYSMPDRLAGLDIPHIKIALIKLAEMHASSAVLNEHSNRSLEKYNKGLMTRKVDTFIPFYENMMEACGRSIMLWDDGKYKVYGEKILKLKRNVVEYGRRTFDVTDGFLNVLCHGDFWSNNLLFRYNDQDEPVDAKVIDFQYTCWGSPAIDLHYFLNTSLRQEIRLHQQDELIQFYYNNLSQTLRKLKYKRKVPTLFQFHGECAQKNFYALISACIIQPVMINEDPTNADFHALLGDDDRSRRFKSSLYRNKRVVNNLKQLLPIFDRKGLLDEN